MNKDPGKYKHFNAGGSETMLYSFLRYGGRFAPPYPTVDFKSLLFVVFYITRILPIRTTLFIVIFQLGKSCLQNASLA